MASSSGSFNMESIMALLSPDERTRIREEVEKKALDKVLDTPCPFCWGKVNIPVELSDQIWCEDCGDSCNRIACLHCVREWLQLNVKPEDREDRKHLICEKPIYTRRLNARTAYSVKEHLIDLMDKYYPETVECKCGFRGTRRELRNHSRDATCPKSIWKCPGCEFRGVPSVYITHTQTCSRLKNHQVYNYDFF